MPTVFQAIAAGAFVAATCIPAAAAPASGAALSFDVLVHNGVGIPSEVVANALQTATQVFRRLDVHIAWLDPQSARCRREGLDDGPAQQAFLAALFTVRLVSSVNQWGPNTTSRRTLGFAVPGTRIATVVYPRVAELAGTANGDVALMLGYVMAHELGHLLLRQTAHSVAGLMHAELDPLLARQGRLLFADDQERIIRATLTEDAGRRLPSRIELASSRISDSCQPQATAVRR